MGHPGHGPHRRGVHRQSLVARPHRKRAQPAPGAEERGRVDDFAGMPKAGTRTQGSEHGVANRQSATRQPRLVGRPATPRARDGAPEGRRVRRAGHPRGGPVHQRLRPHAQHHLGAVAGAHQRDRPRDRPASHPAPRDRARPGAAKKSSACARQGCSAVARSSSTRSPTGT